MPNSASESPCSAGSSWSYQLAAGSIAGLVGGELFLLTGVVLGGAADLGFSPTASHAAFLVFRSIAFYGLLGAAVGFILGGSLRALGVIAGRELPIFALACASSVASTTLLYLTTWWQLEVAFALPLNAPERLSAGFWHCGAAAAAGVLSFGVARRVRLPAGLLRYALVTCGAAVALLGATTYALRLRPAEYQQRWKPSQVAIVALDGLTLRVLAPLIRAGDLPTFGSLVDQGSWGSLLTYGITASPVVWTTIATGRKPEDHGITDFVRSRPGSYQKTPVRSTDRKVPALWNLLAKAGLSSAVVNWLVTSPPLEGASYTITGLSNLSSMSSYPPQVAEELRLLVRDRRAPEEYLATTDRVFTVAEALVQREPLAFVALYDRASDNVQHTTWKYFEPAAFDADLWEIDPEGVERRGDIIPNVYRYLDQRLGDLVSLLDEDGLLLVVSDHGQLAGTRRRCQFYADRVLATLGYAELSDDGGIDHRKSRAYALTDSTWAHTTGINLNRLGREPDGIVGESEGAKILEQLALDLRTARFQDGAPLFHSVEVGDGAKGADLVAHHSVNTRATESFGQQLTLAGKSYEFSTFAKLLTTLSGDHDHQGIVFIRGKGVRRGPLGQRVLTTALQQILWRLTGRIEGLDEWLPLLGKAGLIERATTLDVTPTVLQALELPLSRELPGRPLVELFMDPKPIDWVPSFDQSPPSTILPESETLEAEQLDQLRALDYIN